MTETSLLVLRSSPQESLEPISALFWAPLENNQSEIDELIRSNVYKNETLEGMLWAVTKRIGQPLNDQEKLYCKELYTVEALKVFNGDFQAFLEKIPKLSIDKAQKFAEFAKSVRNIEVACEFFIDNRYFRSAHLLESCCGVLKKHEQAQFVHALKSQCLKVLVSSIKSKESEKKFIEAFPDLVLREFENNDYASIDKIPLIKESNNVKDLIANVLNLCEIGELKSTAKALEEVEEFSPDFESGVNSLLKQYKKPTKKKIYQRKQNRICRISSMGLSTKKVLEEVKGEKFDEVEVFADKLLIVNKSLNWPGKNLILVSPRIQIASSTTFVVSGVNAENKWDGKSKKAKNGQKAGESGQDGHDGTHGQSGGNVLILSDKIENAQMLEIRSYGGNGANGQDGGDGKNGRDGQDGASLNLRNLDQFNNYFPDCRIFEGNERNRQQNKIWDMIESPSHSSEESAWGGYDRSIEGVTKDKRLPINFGNYVACYVLTNTISSFILVNGLNGTQGTTGGNAGSGGSAGLGGFPGQIEIKGLRRPQQCKGADGIRLFYGQGKDGKFGQKGSVNMIAYYFLTISSTLLYLNSSKIGGKFDIVHLLRFFVRNRLESLSCIIV